MATWYEQTHSAGGRTRISWKTPWQLEPVTFRATEAKGNRSSPTPLEILEYVNIIFCQVVLSFEPQPNLSKVFGWFSVDAGRSAVHPIPIGRVGLEQSAVSWSVLDTPLVQSYLDLYHQFITNLSTSKREKLKVWHHYSWTIYKWAIFHSYPQSWE